VIRHKYSGISNTPSKLTWEGLLWISELPIFELYHLNVNGMKKIVLLLSVAVGWAWSGALAQGPMRGEADLQATQKSLEMGLLVEEMEEAGFVLDVTEGFEEEWEEGTWLATESDELDVVNLNEEDAELFAIDSDEEAWMEEDEQNSLIEDAEDAEELITEDVVVLDEEESDDVYLIEDEETSEDNAWWNENEFEGWEEMEDEWELEALENSYEEEDMEVLEALYERG
jgi:hypothetical protein